MEFVKGKIVKKGTDAQGRPRKAVEVPNLYYDDFEFGEIVRIEKLKKNESQQVS